MENKAYEDETTSHNLHLQHPLEETPRGRLKKIIRPIGLFNHMESSTSPNSHIYEDITAGALKRNSFSRSSIGEYLPKKKSEQSEIQDLDRSPLTERISEHYANSEADQDSFNSFHRNLTLPLRRANPLQNSATNVISSSVRVTSKERTQTDSVIRNFDSINDDSLRFTCGPIQEVQSEQRPTRRRRKKDCKHCKNKTGPSSSTEVPVNVGCKERLHDENKFLSQEQNGKLRLGIEPIFSLPDGRLPSFCTLRCEKMLDRTSSAYCISNIVTVDNDSSNSKCVNYDDNDIKARLSHIQVCKGNALPVTLPENHNGMKVNSIYAQEHWNTKDAPIFLTDFKEQSPFQRAYSLPVRTHTPTSENRVNLRRSVRNEPPPHPARLRKHRHGWTLDFARPIDGPGCTRSLVLLLLVVLTLLGIGSIALYIVFEPEKLQIIQQYLRSSGQNISGSENLTSGTKDPMDEQNVSKNTIAGLAVGVLMNTSLPFSGLNDEQEETVSEVYSTTLLVEDLNSTRFCDDCVKGEVCVALVDEDVPICKTGPDPLDPTGCAGLCLINKQKCHRLDVDAFRCVDVEHYCLQDEWTCKNTLCIPLVKHCDGHMNCYDHSDEYNCACNLHTHFQCGNETSCLPLDKRCDGRIDCWDATDEINCTLACPLESDFTCSDGQCILKARFCDGLEDCVDGTDEPHGCQGRCNKHEFTCQNGRCITKNMKCNGIDDCGDGTDEQHCRDRIL